MYMLIGCRVLLIPNENIFQSKATISVYGMCRWWGVHYPKTEIRCARFLSTVQYISMLVFSVHFESASGVGEAARKKAKSMEKEGK